MVCDTEWFFGGVGVELVLRDAEILLGANFYVESNSGMMRAVSVKCVF